MSSVLLLASGNASAITGGDFEGVLLYPAVGGLIFGAIAGLFSRKFGLSLWQGMIRWYFVPFVGWALLFSVVAGSPVSGLLLTSILGAAAALPYGIGFWAAFKPGPDIADDPQSENPDKPSAS